MKHEQCDGCRAAGRDCSQEPYCRCDQEAERKARMLDDPVLARLHEVIMHLAESWATGKLASQTDWERGRVCGATLAWSAVVRRLQRDGPHADTAYDEYRAMVYQPRK